MPFCLHLFLQEYTEEFREIAGKGKKIASGTIADGSITLINQRHVGDDLPVNCVCLPFFICLLFSCFLCMCCYHKRQGNLIEGKAHLENWNNLFGD